MPSTPSELTLLAMNLSGRFAGREIRRFGHAVLGALLTEKNVDLMFGQQTNFKPKLPEHYDMIGTPRAFLSYNKARIKACDEKQYRSKLRDLQFSRKLPFHYLPLQNFTLTKFKTRKTPAVEFIAISWLTDETLGRTRKIGMFKKLMSFVVNISKIEELPIIIGGTFNITLEDASDCLPDGYCCYGYIPENARRSIRSADFFICPSSMRLENVKPIICANLEIEECSEMWLNPEDAFYCDPVRATLVGEKQRHEQKLHAHRYITETDMFDDEVDDKRDDPDGKSNTSPGVGPGEKDASQEKSQQTYGFLRKLPSCPELYDDGSENGTTCYMS